MSNVPKTSIRTNHAVSIRANGLTIGQVQTWAPSQARNVNPLYELNSVTDGGVHENVPGVASGLTIRVDRYDLFAKKMEQAWGINFDIQMLTDQTNPFEVQEKWFNPDGRIELYVYTGVWFTSLGRTLSVQGDRIVNVNATLQYVRMRAFI